LRISEELKKVIPEELRKKRKNLILFLYEFKKNSRLKYAKGLCT
jgi:hypothetical protein